MKDLKKILDLIRKTGDRYLFEDENGELYVLLSAKDYENLIFQHSEVKDFSEEELLNKINKDIAIWKAKQEDEKMLENWQNFEPKEENKEDDKYYFEPVEDEE
ncbi:MAG: hypothetical protein A2Y82_00130 [Candidatus Buchananbacteria bacterium RBG_13_36_9]|uniref:Antitoxin n=1 Tax=Candidatus Buchananbacteria bacterium RBG_13_36_9 TaxID=1797530 RepID=A0A1G1XN31_9BACT|nr:MAG: hypothetical protein A2Y82_00130 [Candidatus Buchananbacteria bacterium RBG_13_36_9]